MSPAQDSHQPTHAAQPAGALNFAPDEDPIAFSFDGEGPPLDSAFFDAFMEQPGFWDVEFASQSAVDSDLNGQAMMPSFDAGGELFDWTQNYWNDGTLGFGTGSASQSAPDFVSNEQAMVPSPFDGNPWMDQPVELRGAEIASQDANFALGQAPAAFDSAQSYLQDASLDGLFPADWTYHNHDAGMPDALGRLADPVRRLPGSVHDTLHQNDYSNTFCSPGQHTQEPAASSARTAACSSLPMQTIASITRTCKPRKPLQIRCDLKGCTHEGTFRRHWELRRHIQTKHPRENAISFVCRAEGCLNKQLPWTFTRQDKLTSHIKANHNRDKVFTACPVNGCGFEKNTLEILGVHLQRSHEGCEEARGVLNAASYKMRKCPLWRCGKYVKTAKLLHHVAEHDEDEVLAAASRLEPEGVIATIASGPSRTNQANQGLVVVVRCPVCNATSADIDGFVIHLWTSHVFLAQSAGFAHFVAWRSLWAGKVCKEVYSPSAASRADVNKLLPWATLKGLPPYKSKIDTVKCPSCPFVSGGLAQLWQTPSEEERAAQDAISAHHLSLLRPEAEIIAELYPHRMQILRLYPEFVSHPVFADFDFGRPQEGIASSSQQSNHFDLASN